MTELETLKAQLAQWKRIVQVREAIEQMLTEKLCESQQQVRELRELIGVVIGVRRLPDILPLIVVERLEKAALRSAPPSGQDDDVDWAEISRDSMDYKPSSVSQAPFDKTNAGEERKDLARGSDVRGDGAQIGAEMRTMAALPPSVSAPPLSNERASEQELARQVPAQGIAPASDKDGVAVGLESLPSDSPRPESSAGQQVIHTQVPHEEGKCSGCLDVMYDFGDDRLTIVCNQCEHEFPAASVNKSGGLDPQGCAGSGPRVHSERYEPPPQDSPSRSQIDNSFKAEGTAMRRFYLQRLKDETGISRTGRVLEGVLTQAGHVITEWRPPHSTMGWYPDLATFNLIHVDCHPSCNEIVWLDAPPSPAREKEKAE